MKGEFILQELMMATKHSIRIRFLGAMGCVTGSATLLEFSNGQEFSLKYLIDLGKFQNDKVQTHDSEIKKIIPELKGIFITHAHADHIGRIPLALESGFKGVFFLTKATAELCRVMMKDQMKIERMDSEKIERLLQSFKEKQSIIDRKSDFILGKTFRPLAEDFQFTASRSSHVLGSCSFIFRWTEDEEDLIKKNEEKRWKYLYHSGDLGPVSMGVNPGCFFKQVKFPYSDGYDKYFVMESTYGARNREPEYSSHKNRLDRLEEVINEVIDSGSFLVIPSFSLDRAQQIQIDLKYLQDKQRLHQVPYFKRNYRLTNNQNLRDAISLILEKMTHKNGELLPEALTWLSQETDITRETTVPPKFHLAYQKQASHKRNESFQPDTEEPFDYSEAQRYWREFKVIWKKYREQEFELSDLDIMYKYLSDDLQQELLDLDNRFAKLANRSSKPISLHIHSPLIGEVNAVYRKLAADTYLDSGTPKTKYISDSFLDCFNLDKNRINENTIQQKLEEIFVDCPKDLKGPFKNREEGSSAKIVLTSSGMVDDGIIVSELGGILRDEHVTILLTGYQRPGTNGYLLKNLNAFSKAEIHKNSIRISENDTVSLSEVKCRIVDMGCYYSGHADHNQLVGYATQPKVEKNRSVFLLHGDDDARTVLGETIAESLGDRDRVILPLNPKQWYRLGSEGTVQLDEVEPESIEEPDIVETNIKGLTLRKEGDCFQLNLSILIDQKHITELANCINSMIGKG